jgi:hypothetical protein
MMAKKLFKMKFFVSHVVVSENTNRGDPIFRPCRAPCKHSFKSSGFTRCWDVLPFQGFLKQSS